VVHPRTVAVGDAATGVTVDAIVTAAEAILAHGHPSVTATDGTPYRDRYATHAAVPFVGFLYVTPHPVLPSRAWPV
jgi:hypothetical protein